MPSGRFFPSSGPLRHSQPNLSSIYGSGLVRDLADAWGQQPGVVIHGWVADPAVVYDRHRLFIAPSVPVPV